MANPFTPASSDSEGGGQILSSEWATLEEGLRQSQLSGMRSIERKFGEVETIYKNIHGETLLQQPAIDSIEAATLRTALLTGETVEELKKAKAKRDRRTRLKFLCVSVFLLVLLLWLFLVIHS